jgi:hypothetical protein
LKVGYLGNLPFFQVKKSKKRLLCSNHPIYFEYTMGICLCSMKKLIHMKLFYFVIVSIFILLSACDNSTDSGTGKKPVYVKPSIDYKGKFRKGYVRMPVSTNKNAIKSQNSSRYYYQTRVKYRRKK